MRSLARSLVLAAAILSASAHSSLGDDSAVKLQGKGAARDALNAMQYKPFDLWSKTSGWKDGSAPTKDSLAGKPVLVLVWASWYKTSHAGLADAQKLAEKYKDLVVLGVHHAKGFEKAPEFMSAGKATFPVGKDTSGEFFSGLKVVGAGPNFYVIDRAGNLRFADVEKSSLDEAAKIVVDESAADAAKAEERSKEAQKSKGDAPLAGPDVKPRVSPEDYKAVKWPAANKDQLSAKNLQGKPFPSKFGKEKYLGKAPDRDGKIVVIDFWATWCGPCKRAMPKLDELSKKYAKDVVVIGISDEEESKVRDFIKQSKHSYPQAVDSARTISGPLEIQGIPHVVVLSTDGVVRWQGNPLDFETLQKTVATLISIDPGVKARQAQDKAGGSGDKKPG